jgi:hypothetical protein
MFGRFPQMRQDFTSQKFSSLTRRHAPNSMSAIFVVCIVLVSGAAFGMAALAALHHFALDFGSIHGGLFVEGSASARAAAAWWAWWVVAVAAVFVGPLSAGLARTLIANWWLLRGPRLVATAAVVLALAAIGGLRPAPSTLTFTTHAALGLAVVAATTLLAVVGAYVLGGFVPRSVPVRVQMPASGRLAVAQPSRGGGSIRSGLPFPLFRQRNALVPGSFSFARLGLAAGLAVVVFAAVSALGGATVLVNSLSPGAARELAAAHIPDAGASSHARAVVLALLPTEERRRVVMPPVAMFDAPPLKPVEPPGPVEPVEPRQRAITASVSGPVPESELTFAKGYSRRRAAQLVANMTSPPSIPQLTAAINIKKIRATSLQFTQQERRVSRPAADNRAWSDNRMWGDNRSWTDNRDNRQRATSPARWQDRYADRQARTTDYDYGGRDRHNRQDRRRAYDRTGDGRFARAEAPYRRF